MKEVYLLFNGDLDNGYYDALFSFEDKKTGIFYKFFYTQPSPKTFQ